MKKHMKRLLCALLLLAMLACMVACDTETDNESSSAENNTSTSDTSGGEDSYLADGVWTPKIGILEKYKAKEFKILVVGDAHGTYQSDDFTTEPGSGGIDYGEAYYTEVKARNDMIEEKYGVTLKVIKETGTYSYVETVREDASAGLKSFDAMVLTLLNNDATNLAQEGLLYDLNTLKNLDLSAPWWDANANDAYSIGNKLYFTTGDITIMNKANTWSILFNKEMVTDYNLEDPYEHFRNGTWTFDKMIEMARKVNNATNVNSGDEFNNPDVVYGMVTSHGDIFEFFGGSGMTLVNKDSEDNPSLVFGNDEASISLAERILTTMRDAEWRIYAQTDGVGMQPAFQAFYTGRALFRPSGFTAITKCGQWAEIEFGILPLPKMLETQDEYYTSTTGTFVACIPKNCEDPEFSAYMLDAYAAGAKQYITPAYIEVNLKRKSLRDDASEEVLEYIFSHIIYDVGKIYNFGGLASMFTNLAKDGSVEVASSLDSIRDKVELDIENVIADYEINEME